MMKDNQFRVVYDFGNESLYYGCTREDCEAKVGELIHRLISRENMREFLMDSESQMLIAYELEPLYYEPVVDYKEKIRRDAIRYHEDRIKELENNGI